MKIKSFEKNLRAIETALHHTFQQPQLLGLACVHRSYWNEHRTEVDGHNERLEFLGDAVLDLIVAHLLYKNMPFLAEGELTQLRAQLVDSTACAGYCRALGLENYLLLGKGEMLQLGRGRESILGDFFESLIGALFLDGGLATVEVCLGDVLTAQIEKCVERPLVNWKSQLQERAQELYQQTPIYLTLEERGAGHTKHFRVAVLLGERRLAEGEGHSKKAAQMEAARLGYARLEQP